ncbi:MAG: hypothetical protein Q9188_006698 [Gyalolechia gomerana]
MNISVGIPVYATATEAIILFKEVHSRKVYVVAAKGSFSASVKTPNHIDLSQWDNLASFNDEISFAQGCDRLAIEVICSVDRHNTPVVFLRQTWDSSTGVLVDIDALTSLTSLKEQAFGQLALIYKTTRKLADLHSFLLRHKQEELIVRFEDTHRAGQILQKLHESDTTEADRQELISQLCEAHAANRQAYLAEKDSPSEEVRAVKKLNRPVDRAVSLLAERKSNRARRAEIVSTQDAELHLSSLDLGDSVGAFRSTCSICCGKDQTMSVVLEKLESVEENTFHFFLNFPLLTAQRQQNADRISSQCICFQCATFMGGKSIFQEELSAILPVVSCIREDKRYINHQLPVAITAGLATGAGHCTDVLSLLDHTLRTKQWCSSQANIPQSEPEVFYGRQTLEWMLNNLSFILALHERDSATKQVVPQAMIEQTKVTTLLDVIVSSFMVQLLHARNDREWIYPFMQLIYRVFNATNVPRDMGDTSILNSGHFWPKLRIFLQQDKMGKNS